MKTFENHPLTARVAVCRIYWWEDCQGCPLLATCTAPMARPYTVDDVDARMDRLEKMARDHLAGVANA